MRPVMRHLSESQESRVMSGSWFPEDLLQALSTAPGDPRWEIEKVERLQDHPMRSRLEAALSSIPEDVIERFLTDPVCSGWIRFCGTTANSRQVRLEVLIAFTYQEIYARRSVLLRQTSGRPAPYDHPAVADLQADKDLLVPLSTFDCRLGYLVRNGYVFSPPPPLRELNSHYWTTQALLRLSEPAGVRVRLDPLLVSPAASYRAPFYKMLVFGRDLDWQRLSDLKGEESARWMPDELTTAECEFTDLTWRRRSDGVHLECEEIPKDAESRPGRYFHAIYDPDSEAFSHADAAVRYYGTAELQQRRRSHLKDLSKVGARVKLFRVDGSLNRTAWATLFGSFFVWNNDVQQYVTGTREFSVERSPILGERT